MMIQKLGGLNRLACILSKLRLNDVKLFLMGLGVTLLLKWFANSPGTPEFKCLSDGSLVYNTEKYSLFSLTDVSYSEHLAKKINIYCYILTEPREHFSKAYHVQTTWARRCTRYSFVSSKEEKLIKVLAVNRTQNYVKNSWISMRETLRALDKQTYKAAYFLKADDTTYVIMENLRNALEYINPRIPFIMGHVSEVYPNEFTLSGSFGYVMSKAALELIVLKGLDRLTECGPIQNVREDIQISKCAKALGIELKDSIDMFGMSRFSNVPIKNLFGTFNNSNNASGILRWNPIETDYTQSVYDLKKLPASPLLISFGGLIPVRMYVLEYLIYHLRPIGITHRILQNQSYSSVVNRIHITN
ncbi:hypothetical protein MN116_005853 [Schistosoma mekongi]|uniref:Glycoprotein-N-acetylgalactosamine 3-beta-galactosyltransferase 1 n=1 Tax=Schistosoma mekongi TaxID=38744 RepID=A0AAE1ZAG2_SCHME|nr:hypothetical protein MN116_005853 [Schistosoma mekongi]